ncbi:hypothetical protein ACFQO9_09930 [Chryseobacterium zhengzhouense]|uniref:DUF4468 domain-containing protein n=1 Tax=Chryseobacterium zhengzhouense TaxID=1636086 RepID=A0ABW2LWR6_9FLAO
MKNKLIKVFFSLISIFSLAQTKISSDEIQIKKSLTYFVNCVKAKNMNQAVSCIYPKFFTIVPKEQMIQGLEMAYNNPVLKVNIQNFDFGVIEKPELIGNEYFSITNYGFKMQCDVSAANDEMQMNIEKALKSKYGKNNVKAVRKGIYDIDAKMRACAVSKDRKLWKFLVLEKSYKPYLDKILPKKVIDKI